MREIIHAHENGKYVALDHLDAVVIDHGTKMLRVGLERITVASPRHWHFLLRLLESANELVPYEAFPGVRLEGPLARHGASQCATYVSPALNAIGMVLETVDQEGFRLHTDPKESLECCQHLALGEPLPTRVRSTRRGLGQRLMKPVPLRCASTRAMRARSGQRTP